MVFGTRTISVLQHPLAIIQTPHDEAVHWWTPITTVCLMATTSALMFHRASTLMRHGEDAPTATQTPTACSTEPISAAMFRPDRTPIQRALAVRCQTATETTLQTPMMHVLINPELRTPIAHAMVAQACSESLADVWTSRSRCTLRPIAIAFNAGRIGCCKPSRTQWLQSPSFVASASKDTPTSAETTI
jgi:hypothetical protein